MKRTGSVALLATLTSPMKARAPAGVKDMPGEPLGADQTFPG
ncbi:hypothetical protein OAK38_07940 [Verrucomicrobia bacterium]|nr:hypothetical protein [Verrucomicrobiota bacterium]